MMKPSTPRSIFLLFLFAALSWPARAQLTAQQQISDEFVRSAMAFMGYSQMTEGDAPFVLAGTLLDAAVQLNPKNETAWAMRVELAEAAGDQEAYESALTGYLETGVKDDRARFKLIRFRLTKSDTLDAQLRSLEQLLDSEAGRALSGPLRSRVASLAASIAGELLDKKSQRRWAVEAARMDAGNVDAARLMRDLVIELGGDNVRIGTATVNIIRANPTDPVPRIEFASLLTDEAAFTRAAQQFKVAGARLSRQPMPMPAYVKWAQSMAMTGEDVGVLSLVENIETAIKNQAEAEAANTPAAGAGEDKPQPKPFPTSLPLHLEVVRLAVLDGEDDKAAAKTAFDQIATRLSALEEQEKDQPSTVESARANLALIAASLGPDLEQAAQLAAALPEDSPSRPIASGWIALRKDDRAAAEQLLLPHAGKHMMADVGLAMLKGEDNAGRARLLSAVIQESPSSLASLAAGRQLVAMTEEARPTATGKTLTDLMGKYPEAFWLVDVERFPWLEVRFSIDPQRIQPLNPIKGEVTVWNTTRFPIAIGEEGPIRRQAMVMITSSSSGMAMPPSPPIVVDLGRRFTLDAGERMIFDTRLDFHNFGMLRASNPGLPMIFDARLLVNPVMTRGGHWLAAGIGGVSEVRNCIIQSKPAKAEDIDRWLGALKGEDAAKRLEAMGRLVNLSRTLDTELARPATLERILPGLIDIWQNGSEAERVWLIMNAQDLEKDSASYPQLLNLALESDSKLVWLALLARQVKDDDKSRVLRVALGRQDLPDISRFAERQRRLLRDYEAFRKKQELLREQQEQSGGNTGTLPEIP